MKTLRTPDSHFANLPEYPFAAHYATIRDADGTELRLHYVDEGPRDAAPVLLLHGEPSWSFLYRKMISGLVAKGHRVVAPDLIGFGKSDKPTEQSDYTFERHVKWMSDWLTQMKLHHITLFCQDWGGLVGLRIVGQEPDRFAFVVASNTFLPTGGGKASQGFLAWRDFAKSSPEFRIGGIMDRGCQAELSPAEIAAYDAPFPNEASKAGARAFPQLVPVEDDKDGVADNIAAWEGLETFDKPFLTLFGEDDPVLGRAGPLLSGRIKGAAGQPHAMLQKCGHFSQEDHPEALSQGVIAMAKKAGFLT